MTEQKIRELVLDPENLSEQKPTQHISISSPKGFGARHTFTLLAFLGFVNILAMNICLSVVIVAMVAKDGGEESGKVGFECPMQVLKNSSDSTNGEFDWDSAEQGLILGSHFYGNIGTQILGGILSEKIGGKWVFGGGALLSALSSLLTPVAARAGIGWMIAARAVFGMGQGVTLSSITAMSSKWIPAQERSTLTAIILAGTNCGMVLSLPISGYMASEVGWEFVFYLFGSSTIVWIIFWSLFIHNSPDEHRSISKEEKLFIESNKAKNKEKLRFPPVWQIIRTPAFIGLLVTHVGNNWGIYVIMTMMPTYLNNIQHISLKSNGLLSAVPYLVRAIFSVLMSCLADKIISKRWLSLATTRKTFNTIGHAGPALMLIGLAFIGCDPTLAITILCIALAFSAGMYSGFAVNHMELTPNFAGTLMGMTTMIANTTGFLAPLFTGAVTNDNQTFEAWRIVFLTTSAIYLFDTLFFIIFAKFEVQPWNNVNEQI